MVVVLRKAPLIICRVHCWYCGTVVVREPLQQLLYHFWPLIRQILVLVRIQGDVEEPDVLLCLASLQNDVREVALSHSRFGHPTSVARVASDELPIANPDGSPDASVEGVVEQLATGFVEERIDIV